MATNDLSPLIAAKSEALEVEYKSWMDPADNEVKAKLAKHIAALHNHGGGYLIFGVNDSDKAPLGACPLSSPAEIYSEDSISSIVKRYLEPEFQCQVVWTEHDGHHYPVVIVPPHGAMPAIAKSGGPQDTKGKTIGIVRGNLYIRVTGPASEQIQKYSDWTDLLERCLQHRADKLASIMRQAIKAPRHIRPEISSTLKEVTEKTCLDYLQQIATALPSPEERQKNHLDKADFAFAAIGYALVKTDGEPVNIPDPRSLNDAVTIKIRSYAYRGWAHFLPLTASERAPQLHSDTVAGHETNYLEGMRIENSNVFGAELDYWRIYDLGFACTVSSYREDYFAAKSQGTASTLDVVSVLVKLHGALAHARFMGQHLDDVANIVIRLDWRGLAGRALRLDGIGKAGVNEPTSDRFVKTLTLPWALVRDDYPSAFSDLALALFSVFNLREQYQDMVRDPNFIAAEFNKIAPTFRLITDQET